MGNNSPYMNNPIVVWNFKRIVKERAPDVDWSDELIDPANTLGEQMDAFEEMFNVSLRKTDERPVGPDGKVCKEGKHCLKCNKPITYSKRSRLFCKNNNKCKMAYWREKRRAPS